MLKLTPEAYTVWFEFWKEIEGEMGEGRRLSNIRDWGAKLPGNVARLAGVLHFTTHGQTGCTLPISATTMANAIRTGRYFVEHALAVFDLMAEDPLLEAARRVIKWIKRKQKSEFSFRDCHHDLKAHFKTAEELDPAIDVLAERHYIRAIKSKVASVGRPSRRFLVNPATFKDSI